MAKKAITGKKYAAIMTAYQNIFKSPEGELVLKDLMAAHGILTNTYNGDVNTMLFKEGERNVILRILNILKIDINAIYERIDRESETMD